MGMSAPKEIQAKMSSDFPAEALQCGRIEEHAFKLEVLRARVDVCDLRYRERRVCEDSPGSPATQAFLTPSRLSPSVDSERRELQLSSERGGAELKS
ncbi:unnamed protein product [Effrenium voratum]|nr:unnamed protein product [Effrenium voratum]